MPNPPHATQRRSRLSVALLLACAGTASAQYRSMDGSGNNAGHSAWGQAGTDLIRLTAPAYPDGRSAMARPGGPNPRDVSNAVVAQNAAFPLNSRNLTDMIWQWGQFIDHDLDLSVDGSESVNITTSPADPSFQGAPIVFNRSEFDPATGTIGPREHINVLTAYIDGSMVYGSDLSRC